MGWNNGEHIYQSDYKVNTDIQNGAGAYLNVIKFLRSSGQEIISVKEINQGRYRILKTDKTTYLVMFKRDFFRNFNRYFREQGATGMGESINRLDLQNATLNGVMDIIFIYPSCHIYSISVSDFLSNGFRRVNKEGKETISVSIHLLKRENS